MNLSDIPEQLRPLTRNTWRPNISDGEGAPRGTRFGGRPWLPAGGTWPACLNCCLPLTLIAQVDLDAAPALVRERFGGGLVQLFYCTNQEMQCEVECAAFFPFAKSVVARRIATTIGSIATPPDNATIFPPKAVIDWTACLDAPGREEMSDAGVKWDDAWYQLDMPLAGEKLDGWPCWVQGVEYPDCPDCGARMTMLLQIDSEQAVPYMWGDLGIGHLTACLDHPERLAFGWACG